MIQKQFIKSTKTTKCRLTFTLPEDIWADEVYLVGNFNDWDETTHPLRQANNGEWFNDNEADGYSVNPHGSHNSIVNTFLPAD